MIWFTCPCGERLVVEAQHAGTAVICPTCQGQTTAPHAEPGGADWSRRSAGTGMATYKQRLTQQARADFAGRTRLAAIVLGLLMLATMAIPVADAGGRTRMPCQWRAVGTTPGVLALVVGTWAAGAAALVAAMLPAGLPRSTALLCAAGMAVAGPLAAALIAPDGLAALRDLSAEIRRMKALSILAGVGATVSIFGLLAVGHARLHITGGTALRICQGLFAVILVAVCAPLTVNAFSEVRHLATASGKTIAVFGFQVLSWVWVISVFLNCISLLVAGLTSGANACRRKISRGMAATSLLLIYIPVCTAASLSLGIPLRAGGLEGLAIGSLACLLVGPRFLLASLAAATFIIARARARLESPTIQILEVPD